MAAHDDEKDGRRDALPPPECQSTASKSTASHSKGTKNRLVLGDENR